VSSTHMSQLDLGVVSNNVYTNHVLGFSFQFPDGWVVADKATQDKVVEAGHQFAYGNDVAAAREHQVAQSCSKIFLLVNQYPQGTKTDAVNPLIAIMAFDSACLPGVQMPRSIEDADKIRQLGNQFSDALAGTRFLGEGQYTIRAFMVQNRLMLDLSSAFKTNLPSRKQPLDVFSSFVFTEDNGYWVAWLFMDGTQAGLDDLKKNIRISFVPSGSATDHK